MSPLDELAKMLGMEADEQLEIHYEFTFCEMVIDIDLSYEEVKLSF